jgi:hypothetical protein
MKVSPNLFTPTSTTPRATGDISEARRAFEAMLSASAARSRVTQPMATPQDEMLVATPQPSRSDAKTSEAGLAPLARPGRVLDIRV